MPSQPVFEHLHRRRDIKNDEYDKYLRRFLDLHKNQHGVTLNLPHELVTKAGQTVASTDIETYRILLQPFKFLMPADKHKDDVKKIQEFLANYEAKLRAVALPKEEEANGCKQAQSTPKRPENRMSLGYILNPGQ
jgi:hypothetical protein